MKVGVVLSDQSPQIGGGYTFETDLFNSFVELAYESDHTFIVFCPANRLSDVRESVAARPIEVKPYRRWDARVIVQETLSSASWMLGLLYHRLLNPGGLEMAAKKAEVEFIWFVSAKEQTVDLPYLTVVWDLQHRLQPWFPELSARGTWESREQRYSRFLRRASVIITGTETGREEIAQFYQVPKDRIRILPHPTPAFSLRPPTTNPQEAIGGQQIPQEFLFYPSQFWPHKNHVNLLLGIKKLRDEYNLSMPVVFVGSDKGNLAYVKSVVNELGLSLQVSFLGFVSQRELVSLYQRAFALTYMTFCGPENLPPLEAFALGCPVVASDVPGAREQMGEAALLVDPRMPDQIAEAIKNLVDDPGRRRQLIDEGFKRASTWTAQDFVRGVFSILDEFGSVRRCWGPHC